MSLPEKLRLVVASFDESGEPDFIEAGPPATRHTPGISTGTYFWRVDGPEESGLLVGGSGSPGAATPGGSVALMVVIPAKSGESTNFDVAALLGDSASAESESNPAMHATRSIDYELILSGRIDFVLPGRRRRTLTAGDLLVVTGVPHAWENLYDEDCTYLAISVGAQPSGAGG